MIATAWAQGGAASGAGPSAWTQLPPLILVFVVIYFLVIRPQQLKQKEHAALLSNLKRNDKVITSGGIHGRIIELSDTVVTLEIAPNVRITVERPQIATVVGLKTNGGDGKETKEKDKKS